MNDEAKTWVFEQYDHLVGSRTVRRPGLDAAVLRTRRHARARGLARRPAARRAATRCEAGFARRDGRGAERRLRRRRAARAHRLPQLRQPREARDRLGARTGDRGHRARRESSGIPVVSGNVSLYNETGGRPIPPTPVIGCVGLVHDLASVPGRWRAATACSCSAASAHGLVAFVWRHAGLFTLAHDVSDGGARARAPRGRGVVGARVPSVDLLDGPGVIVGVLRRRRGALGRRRRARRGRSRCAASSACARRAATSPGSPTSVSTRCSTAGRSRPGIAVSEHGRLTALRDLGLVPQVFDEQQPVGAARRARDRPHALLDDRRERLGERTASAPPRARAHRRARPQRQPRQRRRAARRDRQAARLDLGLRGDRRADRRRRPARSRRRSPPRWSGSKELRPSSASPTERSSRSATPHGFRPLVLGRLGDDPVVASETCALDLVGAELDREVAPGELVLADEHGVRTVQVLAPRRARRALHLRVLLPRASRHAASPASRCTARACAWASGSPQEAPVGRRPRPADPRLGHAGRDRLRARDRHPVQRRA